MQKMGRAVGRKQAKEGNFSQRQYKYFERVAAGSARSALMGALRRKGGYCE